MIKYAPAKVNLYLRVVGKRPDGYHNIETIFEKVALFDKIVAKPITGGRLKIICDSPDVPVGRTSLLYKAAALLRQKYGIAAGAEIKVFKKIPIAAGLGGGSSDAASVLLALKTIWKLSAKKSDLIKIGKKLGSDVPFFLNNCSFATAKGRGDEIKPLRRNKKFWHLIISFPVKLLSKDVYTAYKRRSIKNASRKDKNILINDLEPFVFKQEPLVAKVKRAFEKIGIKNSLVSGSGPSVFALFGKRKEAEKARRLLIKSFPFLKGKGWQVFVVPTL